VCLPRILTTCSWSKTHVALSFAKHQGEIAEVAGSNSHAATSGRETTTGATRKRRVWSLTHRSARESARRVDGWQQAELPIRPGCL
jgi:hypothetical protein